jgi:hypothetical protein
VSENVSSPPRLFFKKPAIQLKTKRQGILDLISGSAGGVTRNEIAAAVGSTPGSVTVTINRINKELVGLGWRISSTITAQTGRRGAPERRYWLVRL